MNRFGIWNIHLCVSVVSFLILGHFPYQLKIASALFSWGHYMGKRSVVTEREMWNHPAQTLYKSKSDPRYKAFTSLREATPTGRRTVPGNGRGPGLGVKDLVVAGALPLTGWISLTFSVGRRSPQVVSEVPSNPKVHQILAVQPHYLESLNWF